MAINTASHIEELLALVMDEKGFVSESDRDLVFRRLRARLENRQCFDCHNRNPTWLSMTYAIFLCLTCSGSHRRMGTHISFVRSCELDKFTRDQLIRMELGGNGRALTFFKSHGSTKPDFYSKLAAKYRAMLDKACQQVITTGKDDHCLAPISSSLPAVQAVANGPTEQTDNMSSAAGQYHQQQPIIVPVVHAQSEQPLVSQPPHVSKASTCYSHAPPQYYDFDSSRTGTGLGHALMAHASATGGLGGSKLPKARKLHQEFDFDEALEEAATVAAVPVVNNVQPSSQAFAGSSTPPVMNLYNTASSDATVGLSPVIAGRQSAYNNPVSSSNGSSSGSSLNVVSNSKYANAKSISSADLFEEPAGEETQGDRVEANAKFRRFNDCKAISSEAFHAGDPTLIVNKNSDRSYASTTQSGIQSLASGAQQTVAKARDWFNNFVFEEKQSNSMFR